MPRRETDPEVVARHERAIRADMQARDKLDEAKDGINRRLARKVEAAKADGVQHGYLADVMGLTRDGLTKFVNRNREEA